jgi:hypothetical protein
MGALDDAIREHLELKRRHGASEQEISQAEAEALGPARRTPAGTAGVAAGEPLLDETGMPAPAEAFEAPPMPGEAVADAPPPPVADDAVVDAPPAPPPGVEPEPLVPSGPIAPASPSHGVIEPPVEEPPVEPPPVEPPPVDSPPVDSPPVEPPPVDSPPVEPPPVEPPLDDPDRTRTAILDDPLGDPPGIHHEPGPDEPPAPARPQGAAAPEPAEEDVLEETPDFLQETPEHDRLWFEQKPPRDFDFD